MKVLIDTNIIRYLISDKSQIPDQINIEAVEHYLRENEVIISYGTLFEMFTSYKRKDSETNGYFWDWSSINKIRNLLNRYQFQFYDPRSNEDDAYKTRLCKSAWNEDDAEEIYVNLLWQCRNYICNVTTQLCKTFAILYMNVKLNKKPDSYSSFVKYYAKETNNFEKTANDLFENFKREFEDSYAQNHPPFCKTVNKALGNIVAFIDCFYKVFNCKQLTPDDFCAVYQKASKDYTNNTNSKTNKNENTNYHKQIKASMDEIKTAPKYFSSCKKLFDCMNLTELSPIEADFVKHCMKQFFEKYTKFKYNDIIDFMNASIANKNGFQYLTFDNKFIETLSNFESESSQKFAKKTQELSKKFLIAG